MDGDSHVGVEEEAGEAGEVRENDDPEDLALDPVTPPQDEEEVEQEMEEDKEETPEHEQERKRRSMALSRQRTCGCEGVG